MSNDKMREAFEREASEWSSNYNDKDECGNYRDGSVNSAWTTWQIAWQAALTQQPESELQSRIEELKTQLEQDSKEIEIKEHCIIHHRHSGVHACLNSVGRQLPDNAPLYSSPQPSAQVSEGWREVMEILFREMEVSRKPDGRGNAPGHGHSVPGIWDSDNGDLAGKPCAWCAIYNKAKSMLTAAPSIAEKREPIKLKDRLPTKDDEDCEGRVWLFWDESYGDDRVTRATVEYVRSWYPHADMLAWMPTGLQRPEPPEPQP